MTNESLSKEIVELKLALQRVTILLESLKHNMDTNVTPSIKEWNEFSTKWKFGLAAFLVVAGAFWLVVVETGKFLLKKAGVY